VSTASQADGSDERRSLCPCHEHTPSGDQSAFPFTMGPCWSAHRGDCGRQSTAED
jgi:hypothetical protein